MSLKIYRCPDSSILVENTTRQKTVRLSVEEFSFNFMFQSNDPAGYAAMAFEAGIEGGEIDDSNASDVSFYAPIGQQEVWAAGVTYFRSRTARMEEAETAGGDVFYDKVYEAERPELFFKATPNRTRGNGDPVCIRSDSTWDVPEPELTLAISSGGNVFGYTVGNDMSSRSIEGDNPLYLPQAKVYTGSCSIGPCLVVGEPPEPETRIRLQIRRGGRVAFDGSTEVSQIKRSFEELAGYLFHSNEFPYGAFLMTGTGVVPDSDFTLAVGDEVLITIDGIGTLRNPVKME